MSDLVDRIDSFSIGTDTIVRIVTIILCGAFTLLVFISVCARYLFNTSILFSVELSKMLFVWSAFLAASSAYRQKAHIRFEFISQKLSERGIIITNLLLYGTATLFFAVICIESLRFTKIIWSTTLPVLGFSQGWLYVSVFTSSCVFILHSLALMLTEIRLLHTQSKGTVL